MDLIEKIEMLEARDKEMMRRLSKLEKQLTPKKEPNRKSRYVKKLVVRKPERTEIHARIDERFQKRAAKKKAA